MRVITQPTTAYQEEGMYLPYFHADPMDAGGSTNGPDLARDIVKILEKSREGVLGDDLARVDQAIRELQEGGLFDQDGKIRTPHQIVSDFVLKTGESWRLGAGHTFGPSSAGLFVPSAEAASTWENPSQCLLPALVGVVNFANFLERLRRAGHIEGAPHFEPAGIARQFMEERTSIFTPEMSEDFRLEDSIVA